MSTSKSKIPRRKARELALSALYMIDIRSKDISRREEAEAIEQYLKEQAVLSGVIDYARRLTKGILEQREEIDAEIEKASENWKLARIARIDRNILRISTFEILFDPEVPPQVSIDEAIELAKKFGSADSSSFVNGILDRIKRDKEAHGKK